MADSFPTFDLNEPVSEDDNGNVDFDLNDLENDDGDAGFDLNEPEDDDGDAAFDLNEHPLEHGNGITSSSLVHVLCYLFLPIVSHIIVSFL